MAIENKRLSFILDMVDKVTNPSKKVESTLKGLGSKVTETQKAMRDMQKQAGDIDNLKKMREEAKANVRQSKALADRVTHLTQQIEAANKPTKAMKDELKAATREARRHTEQSQRQRDRMQALERSLRDAGVGVHNLSRAEAEVHNHITNTNRALAEQRRQLDKATHKQERLSAAKERYAKAEAQANKAMQAGGKMMLAGGAVAVGAFAFGDAHRQFDKGMSAVGATGRMDEETKNNLKAVVDKLATASVFNHVQAAGAAGFLAQSGMNDKQIADALGPVMSLAAATGTDLMQTADIASNIMSGFQLDSDQMGRASDVLTMAANSFNVDLSMLGETMKYLAPVASKLGMSMEESTAMAGLLGNVGIQGSSAGNALKSMAGSLAAPSKAKSEALASIGMKSSDIKDASGNMLSMPEILLKLQKKTKGMGNADMTALFKTMFGEEFYGPAMEIISKGGDTLNKAVKDMYDAKGAAAEAEAKRLDNLDGDIVKFSNQVSSIQVKYGAQMDKFYRGVTKMAAGALEAVNKWMERHPRLVAVIGLAASALGAVLAASGALVVGLGALWLMMAKLRLSVVLMRWALGGWAKSLALALWGVVKFTFGILRNVAALALQVTWWATSRAAMLAWVAVCNVVKLAFMALSVVFRLSPVGWLVTAVMALAAAGVWLWQNWGNLPAAFAQLWESIKACFGAAWDYIANLIGFDPVPLVRGAWDGLGEYFSGLFGGIWDSFMATVGKIGDKLAEVGSWFSEKGDWALGGFGFFDEDPEKQEAVNGAPKKSPETGTAETPKGLTKGGQIQPRPAANNVTTTISAPITIHAAPGMDAAAIGREVAKQLEEQQRRAAQQNRGRLGD